MLEGWFLIAAGLLIVSGGSKMIDPAPTLGALEVSGLPHGRWTAPLLGVVEIVAGLLGAVYGGIAALGVAVVYLGFAGFVGWALVRRIPVSSCGCFGRPDTPPTWGHLAFNATSGMAAVATWATATVPIDVVGGQPLWGLPYLAFVALGVYLVYLLLAELPVTLSAGRPS